MEKLNLDSNRHIEPAPDPTAFDYALAAAKAGTVAFPLFGAGVTLVDLLTVPMRGQRMNDWCEEFRLRFNDLNQKVQGFTLDRLMTDEAFLSAFAQATQAALKTHQKEKLEALRNAVINVALGKEPDPDRQQQFLALLDRFSRTHLVVLNFLNDPESHFQKRGESVPIVDRRGQRLLVNNFVCAALPSLQTSSRQERTAASFQFIELILEDLVSAHLVTFERLNDTWAVPVPFTPNPGGRAIQKMTTHLGEDFLAFTMDSDPDYRPVRPTQRFSSA